MFRHRRGAADSLAEAGGEAAELARMVQALLADVDEIVDAWRPLLTAIPPRLVSLFQFLEGECPVSETETQATLDALAQSLAGETSPATIKDWLRQMMEQLGPLVGALILKLLTNLLTPKAAPDLDALAQHLAGESNPTTIKDWLRQMMDQLGPLVSALILKLLTNLLTPKPTPAASE